MSATSDIAAKWDQRQNQGVDLGSQRGAEADAGYGGRVQEYERGRIYWHPAAGGAHEVHGGILACYLKNGGPGRNPRTGNRDLGFPSSDETRTADGLAPVSRFEWGTIYWRHGGCTLHGELFKKWDALTRLPSSAAMGYGYPIDDQTPLAGGQAAYFERGAWWHGPGPDGMLIQWSVVAPKIGRPEIVNPDTIGTTLPVTIHCNTPQSLSPVLPAGAGAIANEIWSGRLFLERIARPGGPAEKIAIECVSPASADAIFKVALRLPEGTRLSDRALYNIVYRNPTTGRTFIMAPHVIYSKRSWSDFGFIHATDLHVSRRLDGIRKRLRDLTPTRTDSAEAFNNFNDNFRDFIIYANHLHDLGALDVILLTGDLVDYEYEARDAKAAGGNFAFLIELLLGKSQYENAPSWALNGPQELRVLVFTVTGNHDYRSNPYDFYFNIDFPGPDKTVSNYSPHNLTKEDAIALAGGSRPTIDIDAAQRMVTIDTAIPHYKLAINERASYIIRLGSHRIVMLDTGPDTGVVSGVGGLLEVVLGAAEESERNFVGSSPDSVGVEDSEIALVRTALGEAGANGLVLVGLHAPPLNPKGSEFPHYFRESERAATDQNEVNGFLIRRDPMAFFVWSNQVNFSLSQGIARHPTWAQSTPPASFFKRGTTEDLLDYGVAAGKADALLAVCTGVGASRAADLVMCGHGHNHVEYRFTPASQGLHFYMDFYTENPLEHYPSARLAIDLPATHPNAQSLIKTLFKSVRVLVRRAAGKTKENPETGWEVRVQRYANPLNSTTDAADAKSWWRAHRPLVVQSSALGPLENSQRTVPVAQPTFQGFRFGLVRANVITRLHSCRLAALRENNLRSPWEAAIPPAANLDTESGAIPELGSSPVLGG